MVEVTIRARFRGPSLAMRLRVPAGEPGVPYTVRVDSGPPSSLTVRLEGERYEVATGLDPARSPETVRWDFGKASIPTLPRTRRGAPC